MVLAKTGPWKFVIVYIINWSILQLREGGDTGSGRWEIGGKKNVGGGRLENNVGGGRLVYTMWDM